MEKVLLSFKTKIVALSLIILTIPSEAFLFFTCIQAAYYFITPSFFKWTLIFLFLLVPILLFFLPGLYLLRRKKRAWVFSVSILSMIFIFLIVELVRLLSGEITGDPDFLSYIFFLLLIFVIVDSILLLLLFLDRKNFFRIST
jgi:hypothetical protein